MQTTKVWIVTSGDYSDYSIEGVFSSLKGAERFKDKANLSSPSVEEWDLDARAKDRLWTVYPVRMTENGTAELLCTLQVFGSKSRVCRAYKTSRSPLSPVITFYAQSSTGYKHAVKLAAELRQSWLRETRGRKQE